MRISQLADSAGVPTSTVRYYERVGLMVAPARTASGYRDYADDAAARLRDWQSDVRRTLVLTGDLDTMAALHAADPVTVHRINLGGIHHRAGRRERLPYLYLTDDEMARLAALHFWPE